MDIFPADFQRRALAPFATALGAADTSVRRDACGDPVIVGRAGHIYATPDGFDLIAETTTGRAWSAVKRHLSFAALVRDGDAEGAFRLDRLPNKEEAAAIRFAIGIRKRPIMSPELRAALVDRLNVEELNALATSVAIPSGQAGVVRVK